MCKWVTREELHAAQVFCLREETTERLEDPVELPLIMYVVVFTIEVR